MHKYLVVLVILATFAVSPAVSDATNGWQTTNHGLQSGLVVDSSPTLANIDNDPEPEVIIATTRQTCDGGCSNGKTPKLVVLDVSSNGTITTKWSVDAGAPVNSTPAVGDIDGDGDPEIVVGLGGAVNDRERHGGVAAYDTTGKRLWKFNTYDDIKDGYSDGVYSSPTLCDIDGDGDLEIGFGAWDRQIYMLDHLGNSLWNHVPNGFNRLGYHNADSIWSSPACADLNSDGNAEMIIGADIKGGGILPDGTQPGDGGFLYIFDKDGTVLVRRHVPEAVYSSPAVGDLNGDGQKEIVVGTSYYYWERNGQQPYVYAFDTSNVFSSMHYGDAAKLPHYPGWPRPTAYPGFSSPALADLDKDGDLEVVIGSGKPNGSSTACSHSAGDPDCYGAIYAWHHGGNPVNGFPMWPEDTMGKNAYIRSSPSVGDVDNDGTPEILFGMLWDVIVVGAQGAQEGTLHTTWSLFGSPAMGDTDGDGKVEVWIGGGRYEDRSQGYAWRFERTTSGFGNLVWPMFRRDPQHSGRYPQAASLVTTNTIFLMIEPNEPAKGLIGLYNPGDVPLDWEATSIPNRVSLDSTSGTVPAKETVSVSYTIDKNGLAKGTHELGTLELEAVSSSTNKAVANSPLEIPVTLYIGDVTSTFVPAVQGQ